MIKDYANEHFNMDVEKIDPQEFQDLYEYLKLLDYSDSAVKQVHAICKTSLRQAKKRKMIKDNVMDYVDAPLLKRKEMNYYTIEQLNELIAAVQGEQICVEVMLASYLGLRRGEIFGLKWDCVDLEKNKSMSVAA